jgi:hypothetical protein
MAAILAGPKWMVNADSAIVCDSAAPRGARMAAKKSVAGPERSTPQVKGKRHLGQPSQRSQWFSISRVEPFYFIFFHFKLMRFFKFD